MAPQTPRFIWRLRLVAVCLGLVALSLIQQPGRIVADTKLDLTANPGGFLERSLSLWDPSAAFGQLQNQAYGYLFPMGPFFWLGDAIGLPSWLTQRLWWALLLVVAFLGMWRLSAALVDASPWARLTGSVVFALSPRILAELTITSVEVWPMAVAPWILWPLVDRTPRTWSWRITRSAIAVACLGGVNAIASGAALVLPAIWFLTRRQSWQTIRWGLAWLGACFAAVAWWVGPLLILGRHSPPFLDWIEGIAVTSSTASVFESLRGTSAWLGFLVTNTGPAWPTGYLFVSEPALIMATVGVVALGLLGLSVLVGVKDKFFLLVAVVVGLFLLTAGHEGATRSIVSGQFRELLDGALAPFRNLHKFDLVVRIPITIGLVASLDAGLRLIARLKLSSFVGPVVLSLGLVALAAPAGMGQLARPEAYKSIPEYWVEAADWLDAQPDQGAVLMLPAAGFADFEWGSTKDNPLQALLSRPFVHRDAVPLGSAGATRFLDGLHVQLGSGQGGPEVKGLLARSGIRYVLVANDLRLDAAGDSLVRIHSALEKSGLDSVASFGPRGSTTLETADHTVDYRSVLYRPRIEVFAVGKTGASLVALDDVKVAASAGPENLATISRLTGENLILLREDAKQINAEVSPDLVIDGLRRREVQFGAVTHNRSHLFSVDDPASPGRANWEYVLVPDEPRTTQGWDGLKRVRASSSASDAHATLRLGPGYGPAAALDGDPETGWISGRWGQGAEEWLRLEFAQPTRIGETRVTLLQHPAVGALPARLTIRTENGTATADVFPNGRAHVQPPEGVSSWLEIAPEVGTAAQRTAFGIAEIEIEARLLGSRTVVPEVDEPQSVLLSRDLVRTPPCVFVGGIARCDPETAVVGEEQRDLRREVTLGSGGSFGARGWVTPRDDGDLDQYLDHPEGVTATSSSRLVPGTAVRPGAAFDGLASTGWMAGLDDFNPTMEVILPEPRRITGLQFETDVTLGASRPRGISLAFDRGQAQEYEVDEEGLVHVTPRIAQRIVIEFRETRPLVSTNSRTGESSFAPVGVSEIRILGATDLNKESPDTLQTGNLCGFGPAIVANGVAYPTRVLGELGDLREARRLRWELCGGNLIDLHPGRNAVDLLANGQFVPESIRLERNAVRTTPPMVSTVAFTRSSPADVSVTVGEDSRTRIVILPQNYHEEWQAVSDNGETLTAVRINGWMQAWLVPPGVSSIRASFGPTAEYRLALGLGGGLLVALCVLAWRASRRQGSPRSPAPATAVSERAVILILPLVGLMIGGWRATALSVVLVGIAWWAANAVNVRISRQARVGLMIVCYALTAGVIAASWHTPMAGLDNLAVQVLSLGAVALAVMSASRRTAPRRERRHAAHVSEPSA